MEMRAFVENMKQDWDRFGVTVMCDSWTGPTGMSIINFMIYCNGVMFFHKTVNATGRIQNSGNENSLHSSHSYALLLVMQYLTSVFMQNSY